MVLNSSSLPLPPQLQNRRYILQTQTGFHWEAQGSLLCPELSPLLSPWGGYPLKNGTSRKSLSKRRSWARNQQRQGSWWPPPLWGALIVNILRIAKASKGVALYLELSGLV